MSSWSRNTATLTAKGIYVDMHHTFKKWQASSQHNLSMVPRRPSRADVAEHVKVCSLNCSFEGMLHWSASIQTKTRRQMTRSVIHRLANLIPQSINRGRKPRLTPDPKTVPVSWASQTWPSRSRGYEGLRLFFTSKNRRITGSSSEPEMMLDRLAVAESQLRTTRASLYMF